MHADHTCMQSNNTLTHQHTHARACARVHTRTDVEQLLACVDMLNFTPEYMPVHKISKICIDI